MFIFIHKSPVYSFPLIVPFYIYIKTDAETKSQIPPTYSSYLLITPYWLLFELNQFFSIPF